MKTEKETKQDELAAIGIGAMIVFIALILVAAVAAAVIIQTAEKLQQNAQASGDDTQEQMSTKLTLINVVIETRDLGGDAALGGAGANADTADLFVTFELAPGSEPTQADDIGYTVICENLGEDGAVGGGQEPMLTLLHLHKVTFQERPYTPATELTVVLLLRSIREQPTLLSLKSTNAFL